MPPREEFERMITEAGKRLEKAKEELQ